MDSQTFTAAVTALREAEGASDLNLEKKIVFHHPRTHAAITFDLSSVKPLHCSSHQETLSKTFPLVFIDGGSSLIFQSASSCLALLRFAALRYDGLVKRERVLHECFVLLTKEGEKDTAIRYFNELSFFQDFSFAGEQLNTSKLAASDWLTQINQLRRFQELCFVEYLHQLHPFHTIVLDGSLDSDTAEELFILQKWQQESLPLFAFSKSSTLLTANHKSVLSHCASLFQQAFPSDPAFVVADALTLFFVRLHAHSSHVFRIDAMSKVTTPIIEILAEFARDPAFIGYPYPLIEVDRAARVSNEECAYYRTLLGTKIDLQKLESSLSAHAILDRIRF